MDFHWTGNNIVGHTMDSLRKKWLYAIRSLLGLAALLFSPITVGTVYAHEPVFSLGPHTLYKGGIGVEFETKILSKSRLLREGDQIDDPEKQKATRLIFPIEIIYGVTPDLSVTTRIPTVERRLEKTTGGTRTKESSSGLGDIVIRSKYRFWKRDTLGVQQAAAIFGGIKLPTGDDDTALRLGTGSTDFLVGVTAGHEGRRLYVFGDIRYRLNTEANDITEGDVFFYDTALGFRPILTDYYHPDLVLLLELNGEVARRDDTGGIREPDSGGHTIGLGPNFLLSYRNIMMKGGVRFPVLQELNGVQLGHDYEAVLAMEFHL